MGDEIFNLINFVAIQDVSSRARDEERLNDLRERAAYLAKKTGQEPFSFYEFYQSAPRTTPDRVRNALIGAGIGLGVGTLAAAALSSSAWGGVVLCGLAGGVGGAVIDPENSRSTLVRRYGSYLDDFEKEVHRGKAVAPDPPAVQIRATHAADLVAERGTAAEKAHFR
jgi:hypothetical protein